MICNSPSQAVIHQDSTPLRVLVFLFVGANAVRPYGEVSFICKE